MASSTLEKKRKVVKKYNDQGLYPYTRRYINTFDTFFSTIGVNGMNEMIRNFTNDEYDITDSRGQEMAKELLDFINGLLLQYQDETGTLYNLEATPAEGTTYRLAKTDKYKYGETTKTYIECDKHGRVEVECSDDIEYTECPRCREEGNL
jgi:ribonucleoside-triphosphate reductase